jgi:hypothetical protein
VEQRKASKSVDPVERERALFQQIDAKPVFPAPEDEQWRVLIRNLRIALQMYREGICDAGLTDQQTLARLYSNVLTHFFFQHPDAASESLHQPLAALTVAFSDLADGKVPDLFRPVSKPRNRPKNQRLDDAVKGKAARALNCLIGSGEDNMEAARFIARELKKLRVRGANKITPQTIITWRNRCREGNGAVSEHTLEHYGEPLPGEVGPSRAELRDILVEDFRIALGRVVNFPSPIWAAGALGR